MKGEKLKYFLEDMGHDKDLKTSTMIEPWKSEVKSQGLIPEVNQQIIGVIDDLPPIYFLASKHI